MTGQFFNKLSSTLWSARRLVGDALQGKPRHDIRRDYSELAMDLLALQVLATQLPYDPAPISFSQRKLQLIHDRLAQLLLLVVEIEDRLHMLKTGGHNLPQELATLLGSVGSWIMAGDVVKREAFAIQLIKCAHSLQSHLNENTSTIGYMLARNLAGHLADTVVLLHDCDRLMGTIETTKKFHDVACWPCLQQETGYVYHRDSWMAARAALGAIIGIVCTIWIQSAWSDGGTAVSILGVCCALFGNADAPAPNIIKYMLGSTYGVAISLGYSFAVLPRVTEFVVLVTFLAPPFLFAGSMQARPQSTLFHAYVTLQGHL